MMDTSDNLYGTTYVGGVTGGGTVFKLTPPATNGENWSELNLWSFCVQSSCADGGSPQAGLITDTSGNLYGTTASGGAYGGFLSGGTVFKLTPDGTESVLWSFGNGSDGQTPLASLIRDTSGNLYGTTFAGGAYGLGTVFKLTPDGTESVLWSFGNGTDGSQPAAGLITDPSGNLYGTTAHGGAYSGSSVFGGTVFKLIPPASSGGN
jgi:uncharacterized repeat protein (TIGR03803 family)